MSRSSDITITRKEAIKWVTEILRKDHEKLIENAVKHMSDSDLTAYLNVGDGDYYYDVERKLK